MIDWEAHKFLTRLQESIERMQQDNISVQLVSASKQKILGIRKNDEPICFVMWPGETEEQLQFVKGPFPKTKSVPRDEWDVYGQQVIEFIARNH